MDSDSDILVGDLPPIPSKRYFTIGEVGELCKIKPHVLRYWEQEFSQLRPVKRRGNRRYYQHHEVILVRKIRDLLYNQGFTISGARAKLERGNANVEEQKVDVSINKELTTSVNTSISSNNKSANSPSNLTISFNNEKNEFSQHNDKISTVFAQFIRQELNSIKDLLTV